MARSGENQVVVVIDLGPVLEALNRFGAHLEDAADPARSIFRQMARAARAGEVPCGSPHGEASCEHCGATT